MPPTSAVAAPHCYECRGAALKFVPGAEGQPLLLPSDHVGDPDVPAADVGHEVGVGGAGDGVEPRPAAAGLDLVGKEGRSVLLLRLSDAAATACGDSVVDATEEGICGREHEPVQMRSNDEKSVSNEIFV